MKFYNQEGGIDSVHGTDFIHDLPRGFEAWSMIYTVTPQRINYQDDEGEQRMIDAPAGTCVLYPPHFPHYLRCVDGAEKFSNTWLHFSVTDEEEFRAFLGVLGIKPGHIFMLRDGHPLNDLLRDILYERSNPQLLSNHAISALTTLLIVQLARNMIPFGQQPDAQTYQQQRQFEELRKEIYNDPAKRWQVSGMAQTLYMSTNQFINLYQHFFGTTPKQDIINARIVKAKNMLGRSSLMREVAVNCGFENEFYFSRIFKQKTGMTPGQFIRIRMQQGGDKHE